ncbi:hypothetical protein AYI69_g3070 [Smittium culicis]|uniref:Uncharacterized protein n=1 Tax=Smittium culicis TaxID=133412 RepID=A0A1R1YKQ9_9FUNG|nr:hypothetical protein AYI69_g3070 [Smittium culicis]
MMSKLSSESGIKKTDPTIAPELDPRTENPTARTGEHDTPQHIGFRLVDATFALLQVSSGWILVVLVSITPCIRERN